VKLDRALLDIKLYCLGHRTPIFLSGIATVAKEGGACRKVDCY